MTVVSLAKKAVKKIIGYKESTSLEAALGRARARKTEIATVIDVGASDGRWSRLTQPFFPSASYFLIEAQAQHKDALDAYQSKSPNVDYVIAAAGDQNGEIYFDAADLFGGLASHQPFEKNCITVPVVRIDDQVKAKNLQPPFLLKLDTHGFEVPIFEGALETLRQTQLVIVETYNFNLTGDSLRFPGMCAYLEKHGFRPIDLCEPMHRTKDGALWQMDLFFAPIKSDFFMSNSFD